MRYRIACFVLALPGTLSPAFGQLGLQTISNTYSNQYSFEEPTPG